MKGGRAGENFLKAMYSWASCACVTSIFCFIMGLIYIHEFKRGYEESGLSEAEAEQDAPEGSPFSLRAFNTLYNVGIAREILNLCFTFLILIAVILVSRWLVNSANAFGLRACCCLDGCCSCYYGLFSFVLIGFGFVVAYFSMELNKNEVELCSHADYSKWELHNVTATDANGVTTTLTDQEACQRIIVLLRSPMTVLATWMILLGFCACGLSGSCGGAAKFAMETADEVEHGNFRGLDDDEEALVDNEEDEE